MRSLQKCAGFSLIELMLVSVMMAILALTFGSMLYFTYKGWQQNMAAVELQRTAYLTMRTIASEIRHTTSAPDIESKKITLGDDSRPGKPAGERTIEIANGALTFKRGTSAPRDLIQDQYLNEATSEFSEITINGNAAIQIELSLTDDFAGSSTTNRYVILKRN